MHTEKKVRGVIGDLCESRVEENLHAHVEKCKTLPGYEPLEF